MSKVDFVSTLHEKYPYMDKKELASLVNRAKGIFYSRMFPCDLLVDEDSYPIPKRFYYWIIACCDELIEKSGMSSAVAYSENGYSITFDSAQVSDKLLSEIPRVVGGIK